MPRRSRQFSEFSKQLRTIHLQALPSTEPISVSIGLSLGAAVNFCTAQSARAKQSIRFALPRAYYLVGRLLQLPSRATAVALGSLSGSLIKKSAAPCQR